MGGDPTLVPLRHMCHTEDNLSEALRGCGFEFFLHCLLWWGRFLAELLCALQQQRKGLAQAEHVGFREQSRVWFQHLIQFVLPRLKYEMVASQTFKGEGEGRREPSQI